MDRLTRFACVGLTATLASAVWLRGAPASAGPGQNSPAFPAPAELWPDNFAPAPTPLPMNQIPANRDSTDYISQTIAGLQTGHELFGAVATAGGYVFVAYNAGVQAWDPSNNPDNPARVAVRDGWSNNHWLDFPPPGEADTFTHSIAAAPLADGDILVAVGGNEFAGVSLWRFDPDTNNLSAAYQAAGNTQHIDVTVYDGRVYALSATTGGVYLLDASAAAEANPCVDVLADPTCPGVVLGQVNGIASSYTISARTLSDDSGQHFMVASSKVGQNGGTLQLVEITDPSSPETALVRSDDYAGTSNSATLFAKDDSAYLAVLSYGFVGQDASLELDVHDIGPCLGAPCSLGPPVASSDTYLASPARRTLEYSVDDRDNDDPADDEHFMHSTRASVGASGPQEEYLFHLRGLSPVAADNGPITTLTADGPTYADSCIGEDVGYWGWYYDGHDFGLRNVSPLGGVFLSNRFYRVARGVFDVHVWTRSDPVIPDPGGDGDGDPTTGDGDGDGDPATTGDGDGDPTGDGDGDPTSDTDAEESSGTATEGTGGTSDAGAADAGMDEGCNCSLDEDRTPRGGPFGFALLVLIGARWRRVRGPGAASRDRRRGRR